MLKPSLVVNAVITTLQTIQPFVAAMNGAQNIKAHSFVNGQVVPIMTDIYEMTSPSCLVVYEGTLGGNFDGMTMWKHHLTVYLKAPNQATVQAPLGYEDLVWLVVNGAVNGTQLNIRQISVIPEVTLVDTPTITRLTDETRTDFFKIDMVFPEIGDN
ncbi:MAG TPA: hypothetical protein VGN17_00440 [Bryobacteraceae bacterium]|jgi:hypothetical protein